MSDETDKEIIESITGMINNVRLIMHNILNIIYGQSNKCGDDTNNGTDVDTNNNKEKRK